MSVFLFVFALLFIREPVVSDYCPDFGQPAFVAVSDYRAIEVIESTETDLLKEPLNWNASDDIWRGYQAVKAFDQPDNVGLRYFMRFRLANEDERWIMVLGSRDTPEHYYVYVFQNTTPYADRHGRHYGHHPCRAFRIENGIIDSWIERLR